jgi:hypothetical protein
MAAGRNGGSIAQLGVATRSPNWCVDGVIRETEAGGDVETFGHVRRLAASRACFSAAQSGAYFSASSYLASACSG